MNKSNRFLAGVLMAAVAALPVMAAEAHHATKPAGKNHEVTAEVVSVDASAHTVTIKGDDGANKTVKVMGKAVNELANMKPGKYTITCHDNDKGEHVGATAFKAAA